MIVNVDKLDKNEDEKITLSYSENISSVSFRKEDCILASPLKIDGLIKKSEKGIYIDADVDFTILDKCSRCLKDVKVPLNYEVKGFFVKKEDYKEDYFGDYDVFLFDGVEIDLLDVIDQTLDFNIPSKVLCSDDCKGLCVKCGANLNEKEFSCNDHICDEEYLDPRFAKLKDLLKN